jgi:large subunit ribosomal protein L10
VNREQKAAAIAEIAGQIQESEAVFAVDYRGISVAQVGALRGRLRDADATFRIVKNTLTERAAEQSDAAVLKELLVGPTALTFVRGDAAAAAKAIADYQRATGGQLLAFKGGLMNGDPLDAAQITAISKLPSREVLYGQLVGVVASPITGLARGLNALLSGVAVALGAVLEKKQSGEIPAGEAPAAPAAEAAAATADDTTDQDAEAPEAAASTEDPAEGAGGTDSTETETQEG